MFEFATLLFYGSIALTIILPCMAVSFGQSNVSQAMTDALNRQPQAAGDLQKIYYSVLALSEMGVVLALIISILAMTNEPPHSFMEALAYLALPIAIGFPGALVGYLSSRPGIQAIKTVAQYPKVAPRLITLVILILSVMQSAVIFGFIIALIVKNYALEVHDVLDVVKMFASSLAVGLSSIGPVLGLTLFGERACESLRLHERAHEEVIPFAFVTQALIESPVLFSLIIALILLFWPFPATIFTVKASIIFIASALIIGCSTFGAGLGSGIIAASACKQMGEKPNIASSISRSSLIFQTLVDTATIYGLLICFLLLFTKL